MANVRRTKEADRDLLEIWTFIAADNPHAADRVLDRFDSLFKILARSPLIGRAREELAPGLRSFPADRYVIFYRKVKGGIAIARVVSGSRDIDDIFD